MAGTYTELPSTLATDQRAGRASKAHFRVNAPAVNFYRRLPMPRHVSRPPRFRGLVSEDSEEPSKALRNNILTTPKVAPGRPGPRVGRRSVVFREFSIFRLRWTPDGDSQLWLHLGDREHAHLTHAVPSAPATDVETCRHRCPAPLNLVGWDLTGGIASTPRLQRGSSEVEKLPQATGRLQVGSLRRFSQFPASLSPS